MMPTPTGVAGAHRGDAGEIGLDGRDAAALDAGFVHVAGVEIGDLTVGRVRAASGRLEDRALLLLELLRQDHADAVGGAVGRDRVRLEPAVVGEPPEIVARLDGHIASGEVDAPGAVFGLGGGMAGMRIGGGLRDERRGAG
jgi:hypothetical protein